MRWNRNGWLWGFIGVLVVFLTGLGYLQFKASECGYTLGCVFNNCRQISFLENPTRGPNPLMEGSLVYGNNEKKQIMSISGVIKNREITNESLDLDLETKEGEIFKVSLLLVDSKIDDIEIGRAVLVKQSVYNLTCQKGLAKGDLDNRIKEKKLVSDYSREELEEIVKMGDFITVMPEARGGVNHEKNGRIISNWIIIRRFI